MSLISRTYVYSLAGGVYAFVGGLALHQGWLVLSIAVSLGVVIWTFSMVQVVHRAYWEGGNSALSWLMSLPPENRDDIMKRYDEAKGQGVDLYLIPREES